MTVKVVVAPGPAEATELQLARVKRRLRQLDVAEATGIDEAVISKAERGLRWLNDIDIGKLAQFYGVSFETVCRWLRDARQAAQEAEQQEGAA